MRATIPIGLPPATRLLRIERDVEHRAWRLWVHADPTLTFGTFLVLHDNGKITRVTSREEGDDIELIKGEDK